MHARHSTASATLASPGTARYVVQSSDVLEDMRVNVSDEATNAVVWYKERFLADDEIVENVVENRTSMVRWTIHRPTRGWYIRLRAPHFPPRVFIQLAPVPASAPHHADAALAFSARTSVPALLPPPAPDPAASTSALHSYPPTPPVALVVQPPSPTSVHARLASVARASTPAPSQITDFVLAPHVPPAPAKSASLFARALSALRSSQPDSRSFTLRRLQPPPEPAAPPPPYAQADAATPPPPTLAPPLVTFHDRTAVYQVRSVTGVLEIDRAEEIILGVDTSFWVAVSLTYLEFLEERESYLAAMYD